MRRSALVAFAVLPLLAACGDDGSPTIDAGAGGATTSSSAAGSATTAAAGGGGGPATGYGVELPLELTGAAEVPGPGSTGTATATFTYDGTEVCLRGETTGVGAIVAGHVHSAPAGGAGGVVIDLGITTTADGPFEGCAVGGAEAGAVLADLANHYVNLHTAEFPDGAVRAQLG